MPPVRPVLPLVIATTLTLVPARAQPAPGDVLVRFAQGTSEHEARGALASAGATAVGNADRGGWMLARPAGDPAGAIATLGASAVVDGVEPDHEVRMAAEVLHESQRWVPDDPLFARAWQLAPLPVAWYVTRGAPGVVVAVLDTGFASGPDGPRYVLAGRDFVDGDTDPHDENGHGSAVTAVLAQAADNGLGGAGVAPEVTILPVRVLDAAGSGSVRSLTEGLYYATAAGAKVAVMGLALDPAIAWSQPLADAVRHAAERGVVLVGAAGNDGSARVALPAALNEVVSVGAAHSGGGRASYSNTGAALDLVAPGGDGADRDGDGDPDGIAIWAVEPATGSEGLRIGSGSSLAAAHVAGAASLLVAAGEEGRDRIRAALQLSALDLDAEGWDASTGWGLVDAASALAARGALPTVPEEALAGWVDGQP